MGVQETIRRRIVLVGVTAGLATVLLVPVAANAELAASPNNTWVTNGQVYSSARIGSTLYLGGAFTQIGPPTGPGVGISTTTGGNTNLPKIYGAPQASGKNSSVEAAVADGSGGWFVAGTFTHIGSVAQPGLAHILSNGSVDPSFNPSIEGRVIALAVSGSTLYVAGPFTHIGGSARSGLAAFNVATGQLTNWNPSIQGEGTTAITANVSTVYVGTNQALASSNSSVKNLYAIDAGTGALVWSQRASASFNATIGRLLLSSDSSTLYVGGNFNVLGGTNRTALGALNTSDGSLTSWNPELSGFDTRVATLALSGSTLYIGGEFSEVGIAKRTDLAAISTTTAQASTWEPELTESSIPGGFITSIVVSTDGQTVYVGGGFDHLGGQLRNHLGAVSAITAAATSWNPNVNNEVDTLALSGTTMYAGGRFSSIGGEARGGLAAINATSGAATSWNPDSSPGVVADATAIIPAPTGQAVYVAANGNGGTPAVASIPTTGNTTATWQLSPFTGPQGGGFGTNPSLNALALSSDGSTLYIGGAFSQVGFSPRNGLVAVTATTGKLTSWNPGAATTTCNGTCIIVNAMALVGSSLYVGGAFATIAGAERSGLAALNLSDGSPTSWNPKPVNHQILQTVNGTVQALAASPTGQLIYAGGQFTTIGGSDRRGVAAITTASGAVTSWDPQLSVDPTTSATPTGQTGCGSEASVSALGLSPDGSVVYLGGAFYQVGASVNVNSLVCSNDAEGDWRGGQFRGGLAAVSASSAQPAAWNPDPAVSFTLPSAKPITSIATGNDGSVTVGGNFMTTEVGPLQGFFNYSAVGPTAAISAATNVGETGATLNGTVAPNGKDTHYHFEYGSSSSFTSSTPTTDGGSGIEPITASATLTSLTPGTYEYRLVATNSDGTSQSEPVSFTIQAPTGGGDEQGGGGGNKEGPTGGGTGSSGGGTGGNGSSSGGTGQPGPGGPANPPASATAIQEALAALLNLKTPPTISTLLKTGPYNLNFNAPGAGVLTVQWTTVSAQASRHASHKAKPVVIAAGTETFTVAGRGILKVRLTTAGRKMLKKNQTLRVIDKATFTLSGSAAQTKQVTMTIRPGKKTRH